MEEGMGSDMKGVGPSNRGSERGVELQTVKNDTETGTDQAGKRGISQQPLNSGARDPGALVKRCAVNMAKMIPVIGRFFKTKEQVLTDCLQKGTFEEMKELLDSGKFTKEVIQSVIARASRETKPLSDDVHKIVKEIRDENPDMQLPKVVTGNDLNDFIHIVLESKGGGDKVLGEMFSAGDRNTIDSALKDARPERRLMQLEEKLKEMGGPQYQEKDLTDCLQKGTFKEMEKLLDSGKFTKEVIQSVIAKAPKETKSLPDNVLGLVEKIRKNCSHMKLREVVTGNDLNNFIDDVAKHNNITEIITREEFAEIEKAVSDTSPQRRLIQLQNKLEELNSIKK